MKKENVMSPSPPICIRSKMIACPNGVNDEIGTTFKPVTHTVETVVKSASKSETGTR
jgi:hypothetical protein